MTSNDHEQHVLAARKRLASATGSIERANAVGALAITAGSDCLNELERILDTDADNYVARFAALGIGFTDDLRAVAILVRVLESDSRLDVRDGARLGIHCYCSRAQSKVEEACLSELSEQLACDSPNKRIEAIARISNQLHEIIPQLLTILENDKYDVVRLFAITALGCLKAHSAIPHLKMVAINPGEDLMLRATATHVLGTLRAIEALPELNMLLSPECHDILRRQAVESLRELGTFEALVALRNASNDSSKRFRRATILCRAQLGDLSVRPEMLRWMREAGDFWRQVVWDRYERLWNPPKDDESKVGLSFLLQKVFSRRSSGVLELFDARSPSSPRGLRLRALQTIRDALRKDRLVPEQSDLSDIVGAVLPDFAAEAAEAAPFGLAVNDCPENLHFGAIKALERITRRLCRSEKQQFIRGRNGCIRIQQIPLPERLPARCRTSLIDFQLDCEELLTPIQFQVVFAYFIEGLTTETLAFQYGKTPRTIRRWISQALERLQHAHYFH